MRPCRILMTADAIGGVWPYACELSAALLPLGVETVLASLGPPPSDGQRQQLDEGVRVVDTGLPLDWLAPDEESVHTTAAAVARLADDLDVDLVQLNQPALAASERFDKPLVTVVHSCLATWWEAVEGGVRPPNFAWQTDLVSRGLCRSDIVAAPSAAFAEAVRHIYALHESPLVVPNGRGLPTHHESGIEDAVFTAGRLWDRGKGLATLDRAAARLSRPVRAAGATRGPNGESIALDYIEALGVLDGVTLASHLARRPVFVSAARYEPFGLAVLEAAGAGCALVLADIPTFREIWDGAALFVQPDDEDGFVAAIETLLRDDALRRRLGEGARGRASRFTPARMAAGMQALYAQALATADTPMGVS